MEPFPLWNCSKSKTESCPALWDVHRGGDNPVSPGQVPVSNPSWVAGTGVQQPPWVQQGWGTLSPTPGPWHPPGDTKVPSATTHPISTPQCQQHIWDFRLNPEPLSSF